MNEFRIIRNLEPKHFKEHEVWSEYYDFEELEEIRSWGVDEKYIRELVEIAKEGGTHPYYTVPALEKLPNRMRIFIHAGFNLPNGQELDGVVINPNPFVIGIFCDNKIEMFNPNLTDFWKHSEQEVRSIYNLDDEPIFPLKYSTKYCDSSGNLIEGNYGC